MHPVAGGGWFDAGRERPRTDLCPERFGARQVCEVERVLGTMLAAELALGDELARSAARDAGVGPADGLVGIEHAVPEAGRRRAELVALGKPERGR